MLVMEVAGKGLVVDIVLVAVSAAAWEDAVTGFGRHS